MPGQRVGSTHVYLSAQPVGRGCLGLGLAELHLLEVGGIEHREETQHVGCVVDGHAIHAHQVVLYVAAGDVESGVVFGVGLHARQQLGVVQRVGVAQYAWHVVHEAQVDSGDAPFGREQVRAHALAFHIDVVQRVLMQRVALCTGKEHGAQGDAKSQQPWAARIGRCDGHSFRYYLNISSKSSRSVSKLLVTCLKVVSSKKLSKL